MWGVGDVVVGDVEIPTVGEIEFLTHRVIRIGRKGRGGRLRRQARRQGEQQRRENHAMLFHIHSVLSLKIPQM